MMKNVLFWPSSDIGKVARAAVILLFIFTTELTFAQDAVLLGSFLKDKKSSNYTYSKDNFGNTEIIDERHQVIGKIKKNIFGNEVVEDGSGSVIRVYKKDFSGHQIVEDGSGNKIGTYKVDSSGHKIFVAY